VNDPTPLSPGRFRVERARPRGFDQAFLSEGRGGVPLLLVHGWPETRRIWWRNAAPLVDAGFHVIAPDLRGFGDSQLGPDGFHDVVSHSRDLYALVHDYLGLDSVVAVGGDLGGAVIQDLSLRFPGFVERLVIFNAPLPVLKDRMQGLVTRPPRERLDYFLRAGTDAAGLAAELDTPERRVRWVADFYTTRHWAHPDAFGPDAVSFLSEPFADARRFRASLGTYESALSAHARVARPFWRENPTPALILYGPEDHVIPPDFERMAEVIFPDRVGPFQLRGAGHFLQWEAAPRFNAAIASFCSDRLHQRDAGGIEGAAVYVSLGSNLGDREGHLVRALAALGRTRGVWVEAVSPVYETDPVGPPPQGPYLNAAAKLCCRLSARALLDRLQQIESDAGRTRGPQRNTARSLDLDLLFYAGQKIDEPGLQVPHPRLHERAFVLEPLSEIAAAFVHPILGQSVAELAARVRDPAAVRRRPG
jgi:2-amino-4-hydroxy-6-hydroxymethyldihydropteridine diphosphokinase